MTTKPTRVVTDADIKKYDHMVSMYINKHVMKNWNESYGVGKSEDRTLGNTGMSLADIKQHLYTEVVVGLQKYDPDYRTPEGKSVLESTFIYRHLFFRVGQTCIKLTKKRNGYGVWMNNLEEVLGETDRDA